MIGLNINQSIGYEILRQAQGERLIYFSVFLAVSSGWDTLFHHGPDNNLLFDSQLSHTAISLHNVRREFNHNIGICHGHKCTLTGAAALFYWRKYAEELV